MSELGSRVSVKDVDQQAFVKALAAFLKKYIYFSIDMIPSKYYNNFISKKKKDW
jgi:hypothetical protein